MTEDRLAKIEQRLELETMLWDDDTNGEPDFRWLIAEVKRLREEMADHETREQLMFEVARRLFGEDEAKRWLTVVLEAYSDLVSQR
jgi:hypothetical protein